MCPAQTHRDDRFPRGRRARVFGSSAFCVSMLRFKMCRGCVRSLTEHTCLHWRREVSSRVPFVGIGPATCLVPQSHHLQLWTIRECCDNCLVLHNNRRARYSIEPISLAGNRPLRGLVQALTFFYLVPPPLHHL